MEYLGVTSFKRKYPDFTRRLIDSAERQMLQDLGLIKDTHLEGGTVVHNFQSDLFQKIIFLRAKIRYGFASGGGSVGFDASRLR